MAAPREGKPDGQGTAKLTTDQMQGPLYDGFVVCSPPTERPSVSPADLLNESEFNRVNNGADYPPMGDRVEALPAAGLKDSKVNRKPGATKA